MSESSIAYDVNSTTPQTRNRPLLTSTVAQLTKRAVERVIEAKQLRNEGRALDFIVQDWLKSGGPEAHGIDISGICDDAGQAALCLVAGMFGVTALFVVCALGAIR